MLGGVELLSGASPVLCFLIILGHGTSPPFCRIRFFSASMILYLSSGLRASKSGVSSRVCAALFASPVRYSSVRSCGLRSGQRYCFHSTQINREVLRFAGFLFQRSSRRRISCRPFSYSSAALVTSKFSHRKSRYCSSVIFRRFRLM